MYNEDSSYRILTDGGENKGGFKFFTEDLLEDGCEGCGEEILEEVDRVELLEESEGRNAVFSREPYLIRECGECGQEYKQRANDL